MKINIEMKEYTAIQIHFVLIEYIIITRIANNASN